MCRMLEVSTSGYYAWCQRPPSPRAGSDAELSWRMRTIHEHSRGTYGAPRIHAELAAAGTPVGRKRVARLMRAAGLAGVSRRKWITSTVRDRDARPAPDLVDRNFVVSGPNRLWVADITYIPAWAGFLYLAVVLDAFSRRIVGWAMETHLRTERVLEALNMAYPERPWWSTEDRPRRAPTWSKSVAVVRPVKAENQCKPNSVGDRRGARVLSLSRADKLRCVTT
jgi:putative transposase